MENLAACRTCLMLNTDLIDIFKVRINSDNLYDLIMTFTGLHLSINDELPKYICINCQRMLISIIKFKNMCLISDTILRNYKQNENQAIVDYIEQSQNQLENIYQYIQFSDNFFEVKNEISEIDIKEEVVTDCESKFSVYSSPSTSPLHFIDETQPKTKKRTRKKRGLDVDYNLEHALKVELDTNSETGEKFRKKNVRKRNQNQENDDKKKQKKELRICYVCGKMTLQLTEHLITHRDRRDWKCDKCEKMFSNRAALRKHQAVHNPCNVHCEKCGRIFPRKHSLARHIRTVHYPTKAFECSVCSKRCENAYNLKVHQMIHSGEKRYKCKQCPEQFTCKIKYREHAIDAHNMNPSKLFKCDKCHLTFVYNFQLLAHQKKTDHKSQISSQLGENSSSETFQCTDFEEKVS